MCRITCLIIKSLFHKHTLKYAEVVEDCEQVNESIDTNTIELRISVPKMQMDRQIVLQLIIIVDNEKNDSYSLKHLMIEIFVVCSISVQKVI